MSIKKRVFIGGAPTTGKSTMAQLIAKHFDLPWISTDQIRTIMRSVANRKDIPHLFNPEGFETAETFLSTFTPQQIADLEFEQSEATWIGIQAFVENEYTWRNGYVMEGVNILPHLVARDFGEKKHIYPVFLVDEDADRIRDVVFNRGLWGDADSYSHEFKEKEVEWVLLFSHRLKRDAAKYDYPCVEVSKRNDDIHAVLSALSLQ